MNFLSFEEIGLKLGEESKKKKVRERKYRMIKIGEIQLIKSLKTKSITK